MAVAMHEPVLEVRESVDAMATCVAQWMLEYCLATPGNLRICLSGGSTPRVIFAQLASKTYASAMPWKRIHWYWGDERYVPDDDPLSNYRMAKEALLDPIDVPDRNVHRIRTEFPTPQECAADYERCLQRYYGLDSLDSQRPLFDISFLGLGTDGHTASLFPGTEVLQESKKWVAAVIGAKPEARITLTFPALNSSRRIAFLVSGSDKKDILQKFFQRKPELPAVHVKALDSLYVFADRAAHPQNIEER